MERTAGAIAQALAAPFETAEVKFKAQATSGSRALAVAYVDARVIQDRLDDVLGVMGWQDSYDALPDGAVVCRLRIRVGDEWITKEDVGSPSEQPDEGDRRKAAFSDALKRAAVKFGVGRYLYRTKPQWVEYDAQKRQFRQQPTLPVAPQVVQKKPPPTLAEAVAQNEKVLVEKGYCQAGELVVYLRGALGQKYPEPLEKWPEAAREDVRRCYDAFKAGDRLHQTEGLATETVAQAEEKPASAQTRKRKRA